MISGRNSCRSTARHSASRRRSPRAAPRASATRCGAFRASCAATTGTRPRSSSGCWWKRARGSERSDRGDRFDQRSFLHGCQRRKPFHDQLVVGGELVAEAKIHRESLRVAAEAEPRLAVVQLPRRGVHHHLRETPLRRAFLPVLFRHAAVERGAHAHAALEVHVAVADPVAKPDGLLAAVRPSIGRDVLVPGLPRGRKGNLEALEEEIRRERRGIQGLEDAQARIQRFHGPPILGHARIGYDGASMIPISPSEDSAAPIASVKGLRFEYPGVRALDDVSFTLASGTVTALVGPNGAGKSTLLPCMPGLQTPAPPAIQAPRIAGPQPPP